MFNLFFMIAWLHFYIFTFFSSLQFLSTRTQVQKILAAFTSSEDEIAIKEFNQTSSADLTTGEGNH